MAEATFEVTGLDALRRGAEALPDKVMAATKTVAQSTAARVIANAKANLAARTQGEGNTAAALQMTEDSANRQYVVHFGLIRNRPANLPLWLEYGFMTRGRTHHPGTYFMHDAAKAENDRYAKDMSDAAVKPVRALLEGGTR